MHQSDLAEELELIFSGQPWYGDGVIEKLNKIDPHTANAARVGNPHTIGQVVQHMCAWRKYVMEKLLSNESFQLTDNSAEDWPATDQIMPWADLLDHLVTSQRDLLGVILAMSDDDLDSNAPGTSFTKRQLIKGIIHHDVYHVGQIGILNRLPLVNE